MLGRYSDAHAEAEAAEDEENGYEEHRQLADDPTD